MVDAIIGLLKSTIVQYSGRQHGGSDRGLRRESFQSQT